MRATIISGGSNVSLVSAQDKVRLVSQPALDLPTPEYAMEMCRCPLASPLMLASQVEEHALKSISRVLGPARTR